MVCITDIDGLLNLGFRIYPALIERDKDGKKLPPLFPKAGKDGKYSKIGGLINRENKNLWSSSWKNGWLQKVQMSAKSLMAFVKQGYNLAAVIPDDVIVIDCDSRTGYDNVMKRLKDCDVECPIIEWSLSSTQENRKCHIYFKNDSSITKKIKFDEVGLGSKEDGDILIGGGLIFLNPENWEIPIQSVKGFPMLPQKLLALSSKKFDKSNFALEKAASINKGVKSNLPIKSDYTERALKDIAERLSQKGFNQDSILTVIDFLNEQHAEAPLNNTKLEEIACEYGESIADSILEGSRDDTLHRHSCFFKWVGIDKDSCYKLIVCINELCCVPALDESELSRLVNSAYKNPPDSFWNPNWKPKSKNDKGEKRIEPKKLAEIEVAKAIATDLQLHSIYGTIHKNNSGRYIRLDDDIALNLITDWCLCKKNWKKDVIKTYTMDEKGDVIKKVWDEYDFDQLKMSKLLKAIKNVCFLDKNNVNPENSYCFANGEIKLDTKSCKAIFSNDIKGKYTIFSDVNYTAETGTELAEKHLESIIPVENQRKWISEGLAVGLFPALRAIVPFDSYYMLYGKGAGNGKSALFSGIIQPVFGEKAVSHVSLDSINDNFASFDLVDKRVNIATENETNQIKNSALIKNLTSGELVRVRQLYKEAISVRLIAVTFFATNRDLYANENTDEGIKRRCRIVNFPMLFRDHPKGKNEIQADADYLNPNSKKSKELQQSFLLLLCKTAEELCRTKKMTPNDDTLDKIKTENSHIMQFVEQCFVLDSNYDMGLDEIYKTYKRYCKEMGYLVENNLGNEIWNEPSKWDTVCRHPQGLITRLRNILGNKIYNKKTASRRLWCGLKPSFMKNVVEFSPNSLIPHQNDSSNGVDFDIKPEEFMS